MLLSVVVPVYREGEAARRVLATLAARAPAPHEILVVHDEPNDPTLPVVEDLRATHPQIRAVHNQLGRGPAWALRAGFAAARGEAVLVTMADASDDPNDFAPMLAKLSAGYDLVAASRYMRGGRQLGGPVLKGLLSSAAGRSLHWLIGLPTADPTSAFKLYRKSMLDQLVLESDQGFELGLEITVKAFLTGYRVTEVPTTWRDREAGNSNFKLLRWLPRYLRWYAWALRKGLGVDAEPLYEHRFDAAERASKARVWEVLCADFFQRWVRPTDVVLDLGAGFCEFINHISCDAKFAVDNNPQIATLAAPGVVTHCGPAHELDWIGRPVDVVFSSNFFEHMPDKAMLLTTLRAVHRVLRPQGRLLILGPNIRYAFREYWDFLDHHVALSHVSMVEALALTGFAATEVRPRFLPFTTKSALPQWPALVRLYLRFPPLHWLLGKQMFIAAQKR